MALASLHVDAAVLRDLREQLLIHQYDEEHIVEQLGRVELPKREIGNRPRLLYHTRGGTPLELLIRLFLLQEPVPAADLGAALGSVSVADLVRLGILEREGDDNRVRGTIAIVPVDGFYVASDPPSALASDTSADVVAGVSASSRIVSDFAIRQPVHRALDLGTGSGFLAMQAALFCGRVVALDINERAVMFTRFNAELNDIRSIDVHLGDGYRPVFGQEFDLILGNLPFVISPEQQFVFARSSQDLDEFMRRILAETPDLLVEGGFAHFTASWIHREEEDGDERLAELFDGSGCDVWIAVTNVQTPDEYAEDWIGQLGAGSEEERQKSFDAWLSYYAAHSVARISTGVISIRRDSSKNNWFRLEPCPQRATSVGSLGESLAQVYERQDLALGLPDEDLLETSLIVSPRLELTEKRRWRENRWNTIGLEMRLDEPLRRHSQLELAPRELLTICDGRPLRECMTELATESGVPEDMVIASFLPLARQWLADGFVWMVEAGEILSEEEEEELPE